ncbi:hypothetical protein [Peribacillus simplex]|uniref:hypothetical protein n=1 Tax=Peribacillus simplex TaxID=1478 RepID=UPI003D2AAF41
MTSGLMPFFVESQSSAIKETMEISQKRKAGLEDKFLMPIEGTMESFQVFFEALWLS